ncbi:MAG: hypothetical protein U0X91_00455 [Spirosomataceae bacterium]
MEKSKRKEALEALIESSREVREEAIAYLKGKGIDFQPGQWLTIKRYCNRFGIADPQTVIDRIEKGVIPPENVHIIKEYHHTVMVKAVPYAE